MLGLEKLVQTHCNIHLEALCAKYLRMLEVMRVIVKTVNFACSRRFSPQDHFLVEFYHTYLTNDKFPVLRSMTRRFKYFSVVLMFKSNCS